MSLAQHGPGHQNVARPDGDGRGHPVLVGGGHGLRLSRPRGHRGREQAERPAVENHSTGSRNLRHTPLPTAPARQPTAAAAMPPQFLDASSIATACSYALDFIWCPLPNHSELSRRARSVLGLNLPHRWSTYSVTPL